MLCGYPPFRVKGRSSSSLMEAVKHELKFPEKEWGMSKLRAHMPVHTQHVLVANLVYFAFAVKVSDHAKDLIRLMLNVDPKNRITPDVCNIQFYSRVNNCMIVDSHTLIYTYILVAIRQYVLLGYSATSMAPQPSCV